MELFWNPLTLSEAQGFVRVYTVSYRELASSSESGLLEEQQETAIRNNGTVVTGLQVDTAYLVQVWASTAAGAGERSPITIVQPLTGSELNIGAIIGGAVALLLIIGITTLAAIIVVSVTRVLKGKQQVKTME